jgi:hypothetical protein
MAVSGYFSLAFYWIAITNKPIINDQQYALICTTPLFCVLSPTCFSSNLASSGSFLDPSELLEIQIELVIYHIMCGYVACVPDCRVVQISAYCWSFLIRLIMHGMNIKLINQFGTEICHKCTYMFFSVMLFVA